MKTKARVIAFYLPQFYPTPENDEWWEPGFTEWTNVARAKPLFKGHYQPRIPRDLGFYDLRVPETREKQAQLAREAGIEGFCYWHYWFGNGERLLHEVWDNVIRSGKPDFPICLGWANHSWYSKTWDNSGNDILLKEQKYPGNKDYENHFYFALNAFKDDRYIKIDGRPLFFVYDAVSIPEDFIKLWNSLALNNGLTKGICFVGRIKNEKEYEKVKSKGFSYVTIERFRDINIKCSKFKRRIHSVFNLILNRPINTYLYKNAMKYFLNVDFDGRDDVIPMIIPNWDHSPRSDYRAFIIHGSTPELFSEHVEQVLQVEYQKPTKDRIVFLKSWNEWGEGNYMEPDEKWGKGYISSLYNKLKINE